MDRHDRHVFRARAKTLLLSDLHGDTIAEADPSPTAAGPSSTFDNDEYGVPTGTAGQSASAGSAPTGAKRGSSPASSPWAPASTVRAAVGRFLQVDPVQGGSCNAYEYACQDPVNNVNLDGRHAFDLNLMAPLRFGKKKAKWEICQNGFRAGVLNLRIPKPIRTLGKAEKLEFRGSRGDGGRVTVRVGGAGGRGLGG